jgi:hypothetical protein
LIAIKIKLKDLEFDWIEGLWKTVAIVAILHFTIGFEFIEKLGAGSRVIEGILGIITLVAIYLLIAIRTK